MHNLGVGRCVGRGLAHKADVGDSTGCHLGPRPGLARGLGFGLGKGRRGGRGPRVGLGAFRGRIWGHLRAGPSVLVQELRAARQPRQRGALGGLGGHRAAPLRFRSWEEMAGP